MTKDEALKLAQRALSNKNASTKSIYEALAAIKEVLAQPEESHAPFEYWNAVEGWVKIEEVREHFDSVGCGTIYKTAGEGREPLYTSPPKRPWVELTDEEVEQLAVDAGIITWVKKSYDTTDRKFYDLPLGEGMEGDEISLKQFANLVSTRLKEKNT